MEARFVGGCVDTQGTHTPFHKCGDERGFFLESYNEKQLPRLALPKGLYRTPHSSSCRIWRRRNSGCCRRRSPELPTFGHWAAVRLSGGKQADAVDSCGFCARIQRGRREGNRLVQGHEFLCAGL